MNMPHPAAQAAFVLSDALNRARAESGQAGSFAVQVIQWQKQYGRHDLPWQQSRDAYRVWLSEIMLQQTQVSTVIPYYQRFLERFPDVQALAAAPVEDVMTCWSGLGYYTRARNLHRCAQAVVSLHGGVFPADPALLQELPGIGRSTAAAISGFSYGTRAAILDGNVKRVFARVFGIRGYPGSKPVEDQMWQLADALLPPDQIGAYTQGQMDLGATVCTRSRPRCGDCPLQQRCVAYAQGTTAELPERKPKAKSKQKQAVFLVMLHEGRVLLERRPPTGIWGGLLSLPELDGMQELTEDDAPDSENILQTLHRHAQLQTWEQRIGRFGSWRPLPQMEHVFTHFRLQIYPVLTELSALQQGVAEGHWQWLPLAEAEAAAVPAPVRTLLQWLLTEQQPLF